MKNKSCENEKKYYGTMIVAYQLLKQKIITTEEFKQIGELFQNKYKISSPLLINISLQHSVVCDWMLSKNFSIKLSSASIYLFLFDLNIYI